MNTDKTTIKASAPDNAQYRKGSFEARINDLLPQGENYTLTFFELNRYDGMWSVNSGWTPVRDVDRERDFYKAHADKLAEALRIAKNAFTHSADGVIRFSDSERCQIRATLADYERSAQS